MISESGTRVFPLLHLAAQTAPSDDPTLRPGLDPASVTPGLVGFLATLLVVVAVILLIRDMVKRVRRVRYTAEAEQNRLQRRPADGSTGTGPGTRQEPDGGTAGYRRPDDPTSTVHPPRGGKHGPDNR